MEFLDSLFKTKIPIGIKILSRATAIRWMGWGFAESLLPIFFFSFGASYAQAGLLRSTYDIVFILALPIVGMAADRFRATSLILLGMIGTIFIGVSYFLAGVTGFIFFAIIARGLNGLTFALDSVGRETYFRRHASKETLATMFGYFDSVASFWWVTAALVGIILIQYFKIHELLLLIVPASLVSIYVVHRFRKTENKLSPPEGKMRMGNAYKEALVELSTWQWNLRGLAILNFFIALSATFAGFFLPIEAYLGGASLSKTILIGVMFTLPSLFGFFLGKLFDKRGLSIFFGSMMSLAILLASLAFFDTYMWQITAALGIGIVLELLSIGSNELITVHSQPEHFGRISGVMKSIYDMGNLAGPLIIGILLDVSGKTIPFLVVAIMIAVMTIIFYVFRDKMKLIQKISTGKVV